MISRILRKLDSLFLRGSIKGFDQLSGVLPAGEFQSVLEKNKNILRPFYEEYISKVSRADMAASLELAACILSVCEVRKYKKLLDMGSGLSSFVFRWYAKNNQGVTVYSVDDDAAWLKKTEAYLQSHQLDTKNLITLNEFMKLNVTDFDCILHDLNFVEVRINYVDHLIKLIGKEGILVLDDVHKPDYMYAALKIVSKTKIKVYTLKPVTIDGYGRFALAVMRD